jgi:hypothetical protein
LRSEDARFSPSGQLLAVAVQNAIHLMEIAPHETPVRVIRQTELRSPDFAFPHGVEFLSEDVIVVANREAWVTFFRLPASGTWQALMQIEAIHELGCSWFGPKKATRIIETGRKVRCGPGSVRRHGDHLFICANNANTVTKHAFTMRAGEITTGEASLLLQTGLNILDGITISRDGRWIALADAGNNRVVVCHADTGAEASVIRDPRLHSPHGLCFDPTGRILYVSDAGEPLLHVFASPNGHWNTSMGSSAFSLAGIGDEPFWKTKLSVPEEFRSLVGGLKGLDLHPSGHLLVGSCLNQPSAFFDAALGAADDRHARRRHQAMQGLGQERQPAPMMISVHLPKTAGTSFRATLEDHFGTGLRSDYDDIPLHKGVAERNLAGLEGAVSNFLKNFDDVACIHGHFLPLKYLLLRDRKPLQFVTWVRHPIDRLLSHYEFWMREYNASAAGPLHRSVVTEEWSLERFCLSEELRDVYSKFLWAFPLEYFDFIGIFEHYAEDHAYFVARHLNCSIPTKWLNAAPQRKRQQALDNGLRRDIEEFHAADMRLYEAAVSLRSRRHCG